MIYNWKLKSQSDQNSINKLCKEINVSESIAKVLINRGITNYDLAKDYFCPDINKLYDPFLMKDMDIVVDFLLKYKDNNILIYGDYDTDGITSVAMMYLFFSDNFTKNIFTYIPNRFTEGYGLSKKGIDYALENKCNLIITLDCGITAIEEVEYANTNGIKVIITDHHQPKKELPNSFAILNPKQSDCKYPFKELSGCGVAFKLIQGIAQKLQIEKKIVYNFLDFVAVSISGDIVSVMGENRILLYYGLKKLSKKPNVGFIPFLENIKNKNIKTTDIVFNISPKINSSGRMDCPKKSFNILIEKNLEKAKKLMKYIDETNQKRKSIDLEVKDKALEMILINKEEENFSTVLYDESWHSGVLGIVASKLIEIYYRPTIIFCKVEEGILSGSARTIDGVDILELITKCKEYVIKFGGHKSAAGIKIKEENFFKFKDKFEQEVRKILNNENLKPFIEIDTELDIKYINDKFINNLERMEPFGPDNMSPIFLSKDINLDKKNCFLIGKNKEHIKFMIENYLAIGFGLSKKYDITNKNVNIVYSFLRNQYENIDEININIRDIK